MALFAPPFKRTGKYDRCSVSAFKHHTSHLLGIGGAHIVLEIETPDGKKGFIEITGREAEEFKRKVSEIDLGGAPVVKATWADKIRAASGK